MLSSEHSMQCYAGPLELSTDHCSIRTGAAIGISLSEQQEQTIKKPIELQSNLDVPIHIISTTAKGLQGRSHRTLSIQILRKCKTRPWLLASMHWATPSVSSSQHAMKHSHTHSQCRSLFTLHLSYQNTLSTVEVLQSLSSPPYPVPDNRPTCTTVLPPLPWPLQSKPPAINPPALYPACDLPRSLRSCDIIFSNA